MLDRDIRAFDQQTLAISARRRTKAKIWAEVEARASSRRRLAIVVSWQAAVLELACSAALRQANISRFRASQPTP